MQFAGKVVLVTGAQQGIGRAMALEFAVAGADIAINWLETMQPPNVSSMRYVPADGARFWSRQMWPK